MIRCETTLIAPTAGLMVLALLGGCDASGSNRSVKHATAQSTGRQSEHSADVQVLNKTQMPIGTWKPTPDSVMEGTLDVFERSFLAARTKAYQQQGHLYAVARQRAVSDLEEQRGHSLNRPSVEELPTLRIMEDGSFSMINVQTDQEILSGNWELSTDGDGHIFFHSDSKVTSFTLSGDGLELEGESGDIIVPGFDTLAKLEFRKVDSR